MAHTQSQPNPNAPGTNPQGPAGTYPPPGTPPAGTTPPPNTVTDPQTGRPVAVPDGMVVDPQTGMLRPDPTKYYHPPATTDPRFIHADPHWTPQQRAAYEAAVNSGPAGHDAAAQLGAASWADYDTRRAQNAAIEQANYQLYKKNQAAATAQGALGQDAPIYNPDDNTYSIVDKDGKWTHGLAAGDVYAKLADTVKKQYPDWYFGQYATQQQQNRRQNIDAQAFTNEGFAKMGQQTTKYAATSL